MTKKLITIKGYRAKKCLELVHIDVCRPFNVYARGGYEYFITFTDDYSRFRYVYLMHRKFDTLDKFIEFKEESENQLSKHIRHFDLIKVVSTCQLSSILSLRSMRLFPQ